MSRPQPSDPPLRLRPATVADAEAVAQVAYATAYFGEPAERFFPCTRLFAALWVRPYLLRGSAVVALSGEEVVGYCLGVDRPIDYLRGLCLAAGELLAGLRCRQGREALRYLGRALRWRAPAAPLRHFPAHLHVALLPEARGRGAGRQLLAAYLDAAAARGVRGLQLSTTERHAAAGRSYAAMGFRPWASRELPLWRPWTGRDETHVVWVIDPARRAADVPAAAKD